MKKVLFLTGDYWHHADTIQPLVDVLFDKETWQVTFTEDPKELFADQTWDLILSFKDPIENDQIPTPVWCDEKWTPYMMNLVKEKGTGLLLMHAAVTDMESDHPIVTEMIQSMFITHPEQCPVTFRPILEHPITAGISGFTFPENDEHYVMTMNADADVTLLGETISKNGVQPGMWVKKYGQGKVCCITPGHTTTNLLYPAYVNLIKNAIHWCTANS